MLYQEPRPHASCSVRSIPGVHGFDAPALVLEAQCLVAALLARLLAIRTWRCGFRDLLITDGDGRIAAVVQGRGAAFWHQVGAAATARRRCATLSRRSACARIAEESAGIAPGASHGLGAGSPAGAFDTGTPLLGDATIPTIDAVRSRIAAGPTKDGRSVLRTSPRRALAGAIAASGYD